MYIKIEAEVNNTPADRQTDRQTKKQSKRQRSKNLATKMEKRNRQAAERHKT